MPATSVQFSFGRAAAIAGALALGVLIGILFRDASHPASPESEPSAVPPHESRPPGRMVRSPGHGAGIGRLDERTEARLGDLERLARRNPEQALAQLDSFADPGALGFALAAIGRGWGDADPVAAARWIEGLETEDDRVAAALGLMPGWAERRPEEALDWSLDRDAGSTLRELSVLEVADAWASIVPQRAMERFLALPAEAGTERGLHAIVSQWALDAPDQAIHHLTALDPSGRRDEFLEAALVSLTNQDPQLAWSQARRVGDPERVAHIQSQALEAIAEERPEEALRLAATDGDPRLNYLGIARGWAAWDPQAAAAWTATVEDENLREELLREIRPYADEIAPSEGGD